MLLVTTFVEMRVAAGKSRTQAGRQHAVSGRPKIIHTCHAHVALCHDMVVAWHGRGKAYVNQTRPQCVNQMGKTQSKHLAHTAWQGNGMGAVWERHVMCE
jgi:hypothetical protein